MDKKKERKMTQREIEKAFDKMRETYCKKGVDFDARSFVLMPTQVKYIKSIGGDFNDEIFISFTKDEPVKHCDFKMGDYPQEVQEILKQQYGANDPNDNYFPNFIDTASGDDLLDAIEKMTKMSILLDFGWRLFPDDEDYKDHHKDFFGSGEDEDWDDEDEEEEDEEDWDDEDDEDKG